jgi:hypothetical protein
MAERLYCMPGTGPPYPLTARMGDLQDRRRRNRGRQTGSRVHKQHESSVQETGIPLLGERRRLSLHHGRKTGWLLGRRYDPFGGRCTNVRRERRDPRVGRRTGGVYEVDRGRRRDHICSRRATVEEGIFRRGTASWDRRVHSSMGGVGRECVSHRE